MRISDWSSDVCSSDLLEEVGAHVSYGVVGHKTHAKMALVLRREQGGIRRYGHLGTGNYHPRTARLYYDFCLLTADQKLCQDMDQLFLLLSGFGARRPLKFLMGRAPCRERVCRAWI